MRVRHAFLSVILANLPCTAFAEPQALGPLWQGAPGSILLTECPSGGDHDEYCRAITVSGHDGQVKLGAGYTHVSLLWSQTRDPKAPGALVLGDYGGSGGRADLYAVTFSPKLTYRKIGGERFDTVTVGKGPGPLHLSLPFDIEFFNGAPHAGAVTLPLPVIWTGGDFAVDLDELTRKTYSASEFHFRVLAVSAELQVWAQNAYPAQRLYPPEAGGGTPVTVTALVEMMLSGHADRARDLLDRSWPSEMGQGGKLLEGKSDFWAALCQAVVKEPSWTRFGLHRLPHADLIEQGSKQPEEL
jgi:hypothetical protein